MAPSPVPAGTMRPPPKQRCPLAFWERVGKHCAFDPAGWTAVPSLAPRKITRKITPKITPLATHIRPPQPSHPPWRAPQAWGGHTLRHPPAECAESPCRGLPRQWESGNPGGKGWGCNPTCLGAPPAHQYALGDGLGGHGTPPTSTPGRELGCTHSLAPLLSVGIPRPVPTLSFRVSAGLGVQECEHWSEHSPSIPAQLSSAALRESWPETDPQQEGTAPEPWGHQGVLREAGKPWWHPGHATAQDGAQGKAP